MLWNPGALPFEITIEQLKEKHSSHPRNRNIADIFFKAGYIEAWDRGINKIIEACNKAGLPEPDIRETQGSIQITFLKDIYTEEYLRKQYLNDKQVRAVLIVKQEGKITNKKYQQIFDVSRITATRDLSELVEKKKF